MTSQQTTRPTYRVPDADQIDGRAILHIGERGETMTLQDAQDEIVARGGRREDVVERDGHLFWGATIIGEAIA